MVLSNSILSGVGKSYLETPFEFLFSVDEATVLSDIAVEVKGSFVTESNILHF